jgi:hypothetical protein
MADRRCEFVDSRLRRYPPDRASAVPYGQAEENALRFPHLAHRSAAAHKLHSATTTARIEFDSGKGETFNRLPALAYSPRDLSKRPGPPHWVSAKTRPRCWRRRKRQMRTATVFLSNIRGYSALVPHLSRQSAPSSPRVHSSRRRFRLEGRVMRRKSAAVPATGKLGQGRYRVGPFVINREGNRWRIRGRRAAPNGDFFTLRSAVTWCQQHLPSTLSEINPG